MWIRQRLRTLWSLAIWFSSTPHIFYSNLLWYGVTTQKLYTRGWRQILVQKVGGICMAVAHCPLWSLWGTCYGYVSVYHIISCHKSSAACTMSLLLTCRRGDFAMCLATLHWMCSVHLLTTRVAHITCWGEFPVVENVSYHRGNTAICVTPSLSMCQPMRWVLPPVSASTVLPSIIIIIIITLSSSSSSSLLITIINHYWLTASSVIVCVFQWWLSSIASSLPTTTPTCLFRPCWHRQWLTSRHRHNPNSSNPSNPINPSSLSNPSPSSSSQPCLELQTTQLCVRSSVPCFVCRSRARSQWTSTCRLQQVHCSRPTVLLLSDQKSG